MNVEGRGGETALGPVDGYVASRSATGTKTDTPIIETPQSISVITHDQIVTQNPQTTAEALRYTPGIEAESRGNLAGGADIIYGRGFVLDRYLNGLKLQGGSGFIAPQIDVYNLERIEVLRGPASVLYGAASPGGLVNLVSKMPTSTPHYDVFLQGGTINNFTGGFDIGGPIGGNDTLSYRLTGIGRTSDNQVEYNKTQRISVSPALTWRPDGDTSITLLLNYQNDPHVGLYNFVPATGSVLTNPNGRLPLKFFSGDPDYNEYSRTQYSVGYMAERRLTDVFTVRQNFRYMYNDGKVNQVLPDYLEPDNRTLKRYAASAKENVGTVSVDTQLQSNFATGPLKHRLLTGIDYQWNSFNQELGSGGAPTLDIYAPVYNVAVGPTATIADTKQTQNQLGLYAQDQIRIDKWALLLGLRQDWANSNTNDQLNVVTTSQSDSKLTWRAGLVYLFDNGIAPYASYSTSFQPTVGVAVDQAPFKPTTAEQYEVGIKYQPPGLKSFVMASLYQITEQNSLTPDPNNTFYQTQTGEIRSRGLELSATIVPLDGWNVIAAYSYNNPLITKSTTPGDINNMPAFVPNTTAALWSDYTIQEGALRGFQFGAGARYVGFTYSDSSKSIQVPGYGLFDAMVSYKLVGINPKLEGWSTAVNATNILNTKYVSECSGSVNCLYGTGATVLASIRKTF